MILLSRFRKIFTSVSLGLVLTCTSYGTVHATLVLTPVGIADGFVLTTFVSGYDFGSNYGPLAQGILPNGNVVTGSVGDLHIYIFSDLDNQSLSSAITSTPYSMLGGNANYATAAGQAYGAQLLGGAPYEIFASDGTHSPIPGLTATNYLGLWGNPIDGHLLASAEQGLLDINPLTGTYRVITSNPGVDGISVSPDGKTLYGASNSNIVAYDIATGALLKTYSGNGHGPDGTGVISGGKFDGFILVNDNDGTLGLIDPILGSEDFIADGGTRGDFVSPDPTNGSLFVSQIERVDRLSCGVGCSIGSVGLSSVPEPSTLVLLGAGLFGLAAVRRRKEKSLN
jgi:WD40 repeat protein